MVGGVLEEHLRKLCTANGITIEANGRPKASEAMNTDLSGQGVYGKV
jgi:hypothetical protein